MFEITYTILPKTAASHTQAVRMSCETWGTDVTFFTLSQWKAARQGAVFLTQQWCLWKPFFSFWRKTAAFNAQYHFFFFGETLMKDNVQLDCISEGISSFLWHICAWIFARTVELDVFHVACTPQLFSQALLTSSGDSNELEGFLNLDLVRSASVLEEHPCPAYSASPAGERSCQVGFWAGFRALPLDWHSLVLVLLLLGCFSSPAQSCCTGTCLRGSVVGC